MKKSLFWLLLTLVYQILTLTGVIAALVWWNAQALPPLVGGLIFLGGMALFSLPLLLNNLLPYLPPRWLKQAQQGPAVEIEVLANPWLDPAWESLPAERWVALAARIHLPGQPPQSGQLHCTLAQARNLPAGSRCAGHGHPEKSGQAVLAAAAEAAYQHRSQ